MKLNILRLNKNEERRLTAGHLWIYSNEIDTKFSPLKNFTPGEEVLVQAHNKSPLGIAYVNPHSLIAARLMTRDPRKSLDLSYFLERIQAALAARVAIFSKPYYRLVFGESDSLPGLIVDRYGDVMAVQINTAGMELKTDLILEALKQVIPETTSILLRNDSSTRAQEGLESFIKPGYGSPPEVIDLEENTVQFQAPFWQGQKTGWFYDHRMNRARLKSYVPGKRVLDVFSYLGGWGIQAAAFGAKSVTCIDSSALATQWIESNARLNKLESVVQTITDDAFVALKNLVQQQQTFDVVILDPPAFIKKLKDKKEGFIAYQRLNEMALKLLSPDGYLFSCSCSMHLSEADLVNALRRASLNSAVPLQILERGHQGPDHPVHLAIPETDYLKMVLARVVSR